MRKKLSILLLAALFATFAGSGTALAMEQNDSVDATAKGRENFKPPEILPPQV
ncbi:hypothetical protein [Sporosarcina koreensis]|uniref:Uncharacterized protein n=1 Tax=Sporosarcina koreensis TaxID=334735 RepID=A0ABW0TTW8_9BACL